MNAAQFILPPEMNNKNSFGLHPASFANNGRGYSPTTVYRNAVEIPMRRQMPSTSFFSFGDDPSRFLSSADTGLAVDIKNPNLTEHAGTISQIKADPHPSPYSSGNYPYPRISANTHHSGENGTMDFYHHEGLAAAFSGSGLGGYSGDHNAVSSHTLHPSLYSHHSAFGTMGHSSLSAHSLTHISSMHDIDADPRELEQFAERFKQRRVKLGVTQADVGKALANLKIAGVGSLSQSTICRFESLTLSHNNMVALKPILQTWLEQAEKEAKMRNKEGSPGSDMGALAADKKRKRTSIAAPEKRRLEQLFAMQPRPSGEKIAAIAEQLELKKNVVRVWFCNQRQKQKRMKFAAAQHR